jgi:hypothetical protein
VINLYDIDLNTPFLFRVFLLSPVSAILGHVSSIVVDESFIIELFDNFFSLQNKPFLLILL